MASRKPKDTAKANEMLSAAIHAFHPHRDSEHAEDLAVLSR